MSVTRASSVHSIARVAAIESGILPWGLPAPVSRETVFAGTGPNSVLIAGGLNASGSSDSGIYTLSTTSGTLRQLASLASPTHDAAGATLGSLRLVLGGGTSSATSTTQTIAPSGIVSSAQLPRARADATAAVVGHRAFVVGGYDGVHYDASVLETDNGSSFRAIGDLVTPVRYPAVAALNGRIYVFGGEVASGQATTAIEEIDPTTRSVRVVGHLPVALVGAVASDLDGTIYIAGGSTSASAVDPSAAIEAFDPVTKQVARAGTLQQAVAYPGAAVSGDRLWIVGGETASGPVGFVQVAFANPRFGFVGQAGAGTPIVGERLLIADRGNNRLLLLNDAGRIIWRYPSASAPPPAGGFYFPDDAFFIRRGSAIISNQEENETVVEIAYPSGRVVWSYGHPRVAGFRPGYLNNPDDAYLLRDGTIAVADPKNCRVLVLSRAGKVVHQIGTVGSCEHHPPTMLGSPNGDTPLADGNLLISEINGSWIDEYTRTGRLRWSAQLPIGYPSDPQQIAKDRYLVADYEHPGAIVVFDRAGKILWTWRPMSGPDELDRPSLVELLPSGAYLLNDDYRNRLVAVDPTTGAMVWQYGKVDVAGTAPGLLNTPDGFDVLRANGVTPTHSMTG
jgi:outer membrane protein assembly factor BamB